MKTLRTGLVVAGAALLLALLGCAPAAPAAPSSSATPPVVPSSTTTPTPPVEPAEAALVVSATDMSLVDSDGETLARVSFDREDPAPFAAALGEAFGVAAEETTEAGGAQGAEFTTTWVWDGVEISTGYSPGPQCDGGECRGTIIVLDAADFAGVALRTTSGIRVGDSVAAAEERGARPTAEVELAAEPEDPDLFESTTEATRIVLLDLDADGSAISRIRASAYFVTFGNI